MNTRTPAPPLRIGRFRLRIPGESRDAGDLVARHLTERLANLEVSGEAAHLGVVHLRIPEAGMGPEAIADAVSGALGRTLARPRNLPHA